LIASLKKAFNAYSRRPFLFVWGSLLYIFMLITFIFASVGIFLAYFMFLSMFGQELDFEALSTVAVAVVIGLLLLFFLNGINASLARTYYQALNNKKNSVARFYSYAIDKAPTMFAIELVRNFIWLLLVAPAILIYVEFLEGHEYMDVLIGSYGFFMTFVIHMFFTPSFIIAGAFDKGVYTSMRYGIELWRKKHIFFIGLYTLFAFTWVFNFIPFIQIASLFFAYPVVYAAMTLIIDNNVRIKEEK
jgi:hypothetical protein